MYEENFYQIPIDEMSAGLLNKVKNHLQTVHGAVSQRINKFNKRDQEGTLSSTGAQRLNLMKQSANRYSNLISKINSRIAAKQGKQ